MDQSVARRIDHSLQAASRPNLYAAVHKGLRLFMSETLAALGRADPGQREERERALDQVRDLLAIASSHLKHENDFMHPALEACAHGASYRTADDHDEHLEAIEALRRDLAQARASTGALAAPALDALYHRLARFVAENFEHMEVEETHNMAILWDSLDDAQLQALHDELVAAIDPQEMAVFLRWILPAVSHPERLGMLEGMRASAPPEVFEGVLAIARERLSRRDYGKLAGALGVAATPDLVERW
jgi:hypothetical protein